MLGSLSSPSLTVILPSVCYHLQTALSERCQGVITARFPAVDPLGTLPLRSVSTGLYLELSLSNPAEMISYRREELLRRAVQMLMPCAARTAHVWKWNSSCHELPVPANPAATALRKMRLKSIIFDYGFREPPEIQRTILLRGTRG